MLEQFSGILCSAPDALATATLSPHLTRLNFPFGTVGCNPKLSVFNEGGDVCLALGEPRFSDLALQDVNTKHGPSAAWMQAFRTQGEAALQQVRSRFCVVRRCWPLTASARGRFAMRRKLVPCTSPTVPTPSPA